MATKRNDVQGHRRGARGIDENDGHDFTNTDKMSNDAQFGRSWHHGDTKGTAPVDCDYDEPAPDNQRLVESAQGGQGTKVLTGRGDHTSIHQTGIGRGNKSGGNR